MKKGMNHRAIERIGESGLHYLFVYTPYRCYRAFIRDKYGWMPVEMKDAAKDCGIKSKKSNVNTHWFGAQLFTH